MNKKQNKLVSVIIPTYNEEDNIAQCLTTILEQTYQNKEIIVVDDGSTDRTIEIVQSFPVQLIEQSHKGPGMARNNGSEHAKGEVLIFVDADMTFSKDFLEDLVTPIFKGEYNGTFSKEEYISNWNNVWSRCWNYNQNWPQQKMIPDDYPDEGIDFRAILSSEFKKVKGFEDVGYTDTWSLASKLGYKPHSVKGAKYFHSNPDNLTEVFLQARWSAKREYKYGKIGDVIALIRSSFPISFLIGIWKAVKFKEPKFIFFKLVYDLGAFIGIINKLLGFNLAK